MSRGLGDVYKRQGHTMTLAPFAAASITAAFIRMVFSTGSATTTFGVTAATLINPSLIFLSPLNHPD